MKKKLKKLISSAKTCLIVLVIVYIFKPNVERYVKLKNHSLLNTSHAANLLTAKITQESKCFLVNHTCKCLEHKQLNICRDSSTYTFFINDTLTNTTQTKLKIDQFKFNTSTRFTCGLFNLLRRGSNQKVVSFSLYGNDSHYHKNIRTISRQINKYYPDWKVRIYHDKSVNKSFLCDIQCSKRHANIDLCDVTKLYMSLDDYFKEKPFDAGYIHAMMWRWFPFGDDYVDVFASRDTDSFIFVREVEAVKVWLKTGLYAHLMKDSIFQKAIMLGGLFDIHNRVNRELSSQIFNKIVNPVIASDYNPNSDSDLTILTDNERDEDQRFLANHVYPFIKNSSLYHDSFTCNATGGVPWPSRRIGNCFVGCNTKCYEFKKFVVNSFVPDCPVECRPHNHTDWVKC